MLCSLVSGLRAAGFDQKVISLLPEGPLSARIREAGVECTHMDMRRRRPGLRALGAVAAAVREYEPGVVHGWMYHGCIYSALATAMAGEGTPVLWSIHHAHLGFAYNTFSTMAAVASCGLLSFNRRVHIAYCAASSQRRHGELGYCRKRATFIPNGYNPARFFRDRAAGLSLRARFGIPESAMVVGMAGRYDPIKDHATFLSAACRVVMAGTSGVVFLMFGRGIDGDNRELARQIQTYDLGPSTILAGHQDDMVAAYSALDLLVSSSRGEAFPNALCEAMLCEVPCIATDAGDCRSIIGDAGYVVRVGDSAVLAGAIRDALLLESAARIELGARARARIVENYSDSAYLARHISAYTGLARGDALAPEPA